MIDCGRFVCDLALVAKLIKGLNAMYVTIWGDDALVVQHAKPMPRSLLLAIRTGSWRAPSFPPGQ